MADSPPQTGRNASWVPMLIAIMVVGMITISMASLVLLFFAMVPTIVAFLIDRTPQRYSTFCVGGMNFSGVFYYLMELWGGAHDVAQAFQILTDVFALLIIYGAAAFGWLLYLLVPPVVAAVLTVIARRRVESLRDIQTRLVEEWGEGLAKQSDVPFERAAQSSTQR